MKSSLFSSSQKSLMPGGSCLLLVLGLAVATNPILAAPAGDKPDQRPNPGQQMKHLSEALELSDTQKTEIKDIMQSQRAQMEALREDETTPRAEKREKMHAMREGIYSRIRAILTPEQQAKFDAMPRPEPRQGRPEGGKRPKKD